MHNESKTFNIQINEVEYMQKSNTFRFLHFV